MICRKNKLLDMESHQERLSEVYNRNTYINRDDSGPAKLQAIVSKLPYYPKTIKLNVKERRPSSVNSCLFVLWFLISTIIQIPLLIILAISHFRILCHRFLHNKFCTGKDKSCKKRKDTHLVEHVDNFEIEEDFLQFWDAEDIYTNEEKEKYRESLNEYMKNNENDINEESSALFREMDEIVKRDFINRMEIWKEAVYNDREELKQADRVGKALALAFLHGNAKMAMLILGFIEEHSLTYLLIDNKKCSLDEIPLLHMGILNCQVSLVNKYLNILPIENRHKELHRKCHVLIDESTEAAELPLNLAVSIGDQDMVHLLINHGAEMALNDSSGYNTFHSLVFLSNREENKAKVLFDTLMRLVPIWIKKSQMYPDLKTMSPSTARKIALWKLLKSLDKLGFTPLKLACQEGSLDIARRLFSVTDVYHFPYRYSGPNSVSLYDISEVDPFLSQQRWTSARGSVLEFVAMGQSNKQLCLLDIQPIKAVIDSKLKNYTKIFRAWGSLHLLCICIISFYQLVRSRERMFVYWCPINETRIFARNMPQDKYALVLPDYIIFVMIALYLYYVVLILVVGRVIVRRCKQRLNFSNVMNILNKVQSGILLMVVFSGILYLVLKLARHPLCQIFFALSVACSWAFLLVFLRSQKNFAFFSVMLISITKDAMLRFGVVIGVGILAFTTITNIIFAEIPTETPAVHDWSTTMLAFFRLGMGITDFQVLYRTGSETLPLGSVMYIAFVLFINLILMNMLIAAMTDIYSAVQSNRERLCTKEKIGDVIFVEWLFPFFAQALLAVPFKRRVIRYKLPDGSYWENIVHLMEAPSPEQLTLHADVEDTA